MWDAVAESGKAAGIVLYGTETMHVLRAEKGYIIVGQDADGTATPDDVGLACQPGIVRVVQRVPPLPHLDVRRVAVGRTLTGHGQQIGRAHV